MACHLAFIVIVPADLRHIGFEQDLSEITRIIWGKDESTVFRQIIPPYKLMISCEMKQIIQINCISIHTMCYWHID